MLSFLASKLDRRMDSLPLDPSWRKESVPVTIGSFFSLAIVGRTLKDRFCMTLAMKVLPRDIKSFENNVAVDQEPGG